MFTEHQMCLNALDNQKWSVLLRLTCSCFHFISSSLLSRSPFCQWQRRFAPVLWTSATRVCSLQPPVRPRGRWAPSSPTSKLLMEPRSMQLVSRRPSSCSATPAASANRAPVRKNDIVKLRWHISILGMCTFACCLQFQLWCTGFMSMFCLLQHNQLVIESFYFILVDTSVVFVSISHRHGDHLSVVWHHISRVVRAGEESDAQCGQRGEPAPQQLRHDPHLCSHEW